MSHLDGATEIFDFEGGEISAITEKKAFTLAEVLITLGIIGVVAALTLPTLMSHYEKQTVESRLQKFYSTMNQAVRRSEVDNGSAENWLSGYLPEAGYADYETTLGIYNKYFKNYINTSELEEFTQVNNAETGATVGVVLAYMADGSAFTFGLDANGIDINFYPRANDVNKPKTTRTFFAFNMLKSGMAEKFRTSVEPYTYSWDGTEVGLYSQENWGCSKTATRSPKYCAKAIQLNGWKIPDEYPW